MNSPAERRTKKNLKIASGLWDGLSDEERALWNTYAEGEVRYNSMGDPYTVSGINEFVGNATTLMLMGEEIRGVPPTDPAPPALPYFAAYYYYCPQMSFAWFWEWDGFEGWVQLWAKLMRPWARGFYENQVVFKAWAQYPSWHHCIDHDQPLDWYSAKARFVTDQGRLGPWSKCTGPL